MQMLSSKAAGILGQETSSVSKFFSQFRSKPPTAKISKAAEMYAAAATKYKIKQNYEDAARTYELAANAYDSAEDRFGQVQNLSQASQSWRSVPNVTEAERLGLQASDLYLDLNKLVRAAKELTPIADAYRNKFMRDRDETAAEMATKLYAKAFELFRRDGKARSSASRVSIERANLMVLPGKKYLEAGKVYESEANFCANEKLLKYSAKNHFFRAGLCKLWHDGNHAHECFNKYCDDYPAFADTREAWLLANLINAVKKLDYRDYTKSVEKHEECTRLDAWTRSFVTVIQEKYFTIDAEIAFDLNEFLDFNKVPGLDEPAEDLAALQREHCSAAEPDLT